MCLCIYIIFFNFGLHFKEEEIKVRLGKEYADSAEKKRRYEEMTKKRHTGQRTGILTSAGLESKNMFTVGNVHELGRPLQHGQ